MLDLDQPGVDAFECDPFGENWYEGWHETFDGLVDTVKTGHIHQFPGDPYFTFYPGSYYNADNTITLGFNLVTWLGACNRDQQDDPLTVFRGRIMADEVVGHLSIGVAYTKSGQLVIKQ